MKTRAAVFRDGFACQFCRYAEHITKPRLRVRYCDVPEDDLCPGLKRRGSKPQEDNLEDTR